ncbi:wiskott-Aldrich syndrome protein family member 1-like [Punica granatum]|uniref:Wiskott-Aldrich syndrome protein family member 1-like n=1 Tax=Punica granatum TaxID=22663 RepID=A0A6P8D708_PUNGR|nr:wiskott-Aldrich syndrome protein family member 1-like [Punica granatum]
MPSNFIDPVRFTVLEGMVNQLAANMNTNMAKLMGMLRDQNRASSSYTPPPEHRATVDPNPVVPRIYVTDSEDVSFFATTYMLAVYPVNDPLPPPLAPTTVPLPPAAFLSADSVMHTLPPLTIPAQPPIYIMPPPTVHPIISAQVPTPTMDHFSFQTPQPQISFSYPAPPPLNIPPSELGTPTQAAPAAPSKNIPLEAETQQERRIRRMEETIRALQAGTTRINYGDFN